MKERNYTVSEIVTDLALINMGIRERLSIAMLNESKLHITKHDGKLSGIESVGTTCKMNPRCLVRMLNGESVCAKCYADTLTSMRDGLEKWLEFNFLKLTTHKLTENEIPTFSTIYGRFESFGDLANDIQAYNYLLIAESNPHTNFALWTKNPDLLYKGIQMLGHKPQNIRFGLSSLKLNQIADIPDYIKPYLDFVFTVYSPKYIKENDITINCGGKSCMNCGICYDSLKANKCSDCVKDGILYVSEKLK